MRYITSIILILVLLIAVNTVFARYPLGNIGSSPSLDETISRLSKSEKESLKSDAIIKKNMGGIYHDDIYGIDLEIKSISKIDDGVQIFARAWKDGKQIGFGSDGSIDIERFRIHNPPVLVPDPKGLVVRTYTNPITNQIRTITFREDPLQATIDTLAHTVKVAGHINTTIIPGKIGNTTDTFFPDANPETNTVDGTAGRVNVEESWTTQVAGAGNNSQDTAAAYLLLSVSTFSTSNQYAGIRRSFFLFDTSSIPDTDTITSATISFFGDSGDTNTNALGLNATDRVIDVVASSPASNTAIVNGDYEATVGNTTTFGTFDPGATFSNFSTSAYNDISLNASGISNINVAGVSKFGTRFEADRADSITSTWVASSNALIWCMFADQTGTSNDPKLVVVHSAAAVSAPANEDIILFE